MEPPHPHYIDPSHLVRQRGHATDPVHEGLLIGRVQEEGLLCHGTCPLEHLPPGGETGPLTLGLPQKFENLVLSSHLGWEGQ